jgi:hypothetical protein
VPRHMLSEFPASQSSPPGRNKLWSAIYLRDVVAGLSVITVRALAPSALDGSGGPALRDWAIGNHSPPTAQAPTIRHSDECPCASGSFVSTSAAA